MMISGIDIILPVPPGVPAGDLVLGRIRRFWPGSRFVDAREEESFPIDDPRVIARGGRCDEFLIYRDRGAMESWKRDGLTPANANLMIHILLNDAPDGSRELTLVCDSRTEEVDRLVRELEGDFEAAIPDAHDLPRAV